MSPDLPIPCVSLKARLICKFIHSSCQIFIIAVVRIEAKPEVTPFDDAAEDPTFSFTNTNVNWEVVTIHEGYFRQKLLYLWGFSPPAR